MAKQANHGVRYALTRVMLVSSIGGMVVGTWGAIALSADHEKASASDDAQAEATVIEQDGWRWDAALQDWVLIANPVVDLAPATTAPEQPAPQVVVVERQQEIHYVYYVQAASAPTEAIPGSPVSSVVAKSEAPSDDGAETVTTSSPSTVEAMPESALVPTASVAIPVFPEPTQEAPVVLPTQQPPVAVPPPVVVPPPPPPPPPAPTAPPAPVPTKPPSSKGS